MIAQTAHCLVRKLQKENVIADSNVEELQYGLEILLSSVLSLLIVIFWGLVLRCLIPAIVYFAIFAGVRQICGGYHANSYMQCNTLFFFVTALVLLFFRFVPLDDYLTFHYISLLLSALTIFCYAPIENPNKLLDEKQKHLFRIISRVTVTILAALSCLIYIIHVSMVKIVDCTLFVIAVSVLTVKIKERRKRNEKEHKDGTSLGCC